MPTRWTLPNGSGDDGRSYLCKRARAPEARNHCRYPPLGTSSYCAGPGPWPARQSILYCRDQRRRASPWPCRDRFSRHPASAPAVLAGRRDISTDWRRLDNDCAPGGDRGSAYIRTGWARRGSGNRVLLASLSAFRLPRAFPWRSSLATHIDAPVPGRLTAPRAAACPRAGRYCRLPPHIPDALSSSATHG